MENFINILDDLPGVSFEETYQGKSGYKNAYDGGTINIRGVDGNRVLMMIDGIRLPEVYSYGDYYLLGRSNYINFESLKAVEVFKGPASSLYGSDALGGLIYFRSLEPGDLFVDVGANIGSYSILAGSCEGVNVLAFEPVPSTFSWLEKNISINTLDNKVKAMNFGLAEKNGTVHFSSNLDVRNHVLLENKENLPSIEINVLTLDNVLEGKSPTIIKIDVEGFETHALIGAKDVINNPSLIAVIIETNGGGERYGKKDNEIHKLLTSKGFNSFEYDPLKRKLKPLQERHRKSSNTLYLKQLDEITRRVSRNNKFILGTGQKI